MSRELIYGIHAVEILLQNNPSAIKAVILLQSRTDQRLSNLVKLAKQQSVNLHYQSKEALDKLVNNAVHQGAVAEVVAPALLTEEALLELIAKKQTPYLLLIIDGVQDPHNLGACLRSADAAGVDAVIIPKDKAVGVTAVVRKVACGAAESVPIVQVTNLARALHKLQQQGVWLIGAAGEADQLYTEVDYKGHIGIVVGAEGEGMRQLTKKHCDFLVKIPMVGVVSSLNVSVATGVLLFEAVRQRTPTQAR